MKVKNNHGQLTRVDSDLIPELKARAALEKVTLQALLSRIALDYLESKKPNGQKPRNFDIVHKP